MDEPIRVLIVEDDPTLREVLFEVLTARGLQVVASSRGEEAIRRAREEPFDLIVADIRMEGINGLDTIEQARQLQPDIGSIVVSGFASEEETLRAVKLNVAGYLKKPFKIPELLDLITTFVAQRNERLRSATELRNLREALLWSVEQQGVWGEKAHPGETLAAARLARGLASEMGYGGELPRQIYLGTLLRRVGELGGESAPEEFGAALEPYPLLRGAWKDEDPAAPSSWALKLRAGLDQDAPWPAADGLEFPDARLEKAYRAFTEPGPAAEPPTVEDDAREKSPGSLLSLARTLEQGGDLSGALAAYREVIEDGGVSSTTIAALLGSARIAVAQGATRELEGAVANVLSMAEKMGPITFALGELEAARVLRRAGHPAGKKLTDRATRSLAKVNLAVPWASSVIAQGVLGAELEESWLPRALAQLSSPVHLLEVLEQLDVLLPDLLALGAVSQLPEVDKLAGRLIQDYPQEVVAQLKGGGLDIASRGYLLGLLESQGGAVSGELPELLQSDPDPELRGRGIALRAKLGLVEALPVLRVYSLGSMEAALGDQRFDDKSWKTQKTKYLFARLASAAPKPLAVDRVLEDFWPDSDDDGARNNLNTSVSIIRKNLKTSAAPFDPLLRTNDTLTLHPNLPLWHDVDEMVSAGAHARRFVDAGNLEAAMSYFSRVARLYRGSFLDGCYMDWAQQQQVALENLAVEALEQLSSHRLGQHRYREALEYALRLLMLQPDHEATHEVVMSAYLGLDQHDRAVAHFESHRDRLAREDGDEPSMELTRTYQMARYGFSSGPGFTGA